MEKKLFNLSLILAPLFYTLSGFFWLANGRYNVTGGTLIIIGSIFWIVVFNGLFDVLKVKTPVYSAIGRFLAIYGCACGGVAFGLQDAFAHIFGISHKTMLEGLGSHAIFANLVFWIGGPLFPISVFVLGIVLVRTKSTALWAGVLFSLGGILFPVSRILRIEAIAHVVDLLMLIPMVYVAFCGLSNSNKAEPNYDQANNGISK
jgi:hypothetical protein